MADHLSEQQCLTVSEYGLQTSEGVHHGREDHHEKVGYELRPGYT